MGQYLYLIRPARPELLTAGPNETEERAIADHFAYLQRLTADGQVLLAGRTQTTDPEGAGLIVFRADSDVDARTLVDADPAVAAGVFHARLFPYRVALLAEAALQGPWKP